jgi:hypothetical protein
METEEDAQAFVNMFSPQTKCFITNFTHDDIKTNQYIRHTSIYVLNSLKHDGTPRMAAFAHKAQDKKYCIFFIKDYWDNGKYNPIATPLPTASKRIAILLHEMGHVLLQHPAVNAANFKEKCEREFQAHALALRLATHSTLIPDNIDRENIITVLLSATIKWHLLGYKKQTVYRNVYARFCESMPQFKKRLKSYRKLIIASDAELNPQKLNFVPSKTIPSEIT